MRAGARPAQRRACNGVEDVVVRRARDDRGDERRVGVRNRLHDHRVGARRDLRAGHDRERDMQARHRRDRVVEADEQRVLQVDAAHLRHRVDEPVEHARGSSRQEEEDRLRPEVCEEARAPEAVVPLVAATKEERQPTGREGDVEQAVAGVQPMHEAGRAKQCPLHRRLDVQSGASLQLDDPLGVPMRACSPVPAQDEPRDDEIERIQPEAERDLTRNREPSHAAVWLVTGASVPRSSQPTD